MVGQYTAAACCNELQTLASPASIGNIPTSAGMEDYNSMGATAAHQAAAATALCRSVVACELLVMAEALEYQRPLHSGSNVERCHERLRAVVPRLVADRPPAPDIAAIERLIDEGAFEEVATERLSD
jgi:histidine ammonia-lyase